MHYGLPEGILSDQGCTFESKLIAEQCEISKVKCYTLCHTDQSVTDSANVSMLIIGTLSTEAKNNWQ